MTEREGAEPIMVLPLPYFMLYILKRKESFYVSALFLGGQQREDGNLRPHVKPDWTQVAQGSVNVEMATIP